MLLSVFLTIYFGIRFNQQKSDRNGTIPSSLCSVTCSLLSSFKGLTSKRILPGSAVALRSCVFHLGPSLWPSLKWQPARDFAQRPLSWSGLTASSLSDAAVACVLALCSLQWRLKSPAAFLGLHMGPDCSETADTDSDWLSKWFVPL